MTLVKIEPKVEDATKVSFTAKLRCVTPLLMHKPTLMVANSGGLKKSGKNIPTPEDEAEAGAYRDEDGFLFLPAKWILRSMIDAGKQYKNPANKRASLKTVLAATLVPPPVEGYPMFYPEDSEDSKLAGERVKDYKIDIQRVVVQTAAVMRARPRLDDWEAFVNVGVDLSAITEGRDEDALKQVGDTLLTVLTHAGSKQGLGDNRPERSGSNGKFRVLEFSISDEA